MESTIESFRKILDLKDPWEIRDSEVDQAEKVMKLIIAHKKDYQFHCPECNCPCKVHDSREKQIRHLDVCDYRCYLYLKIPRVCCPEHGVKTIKSHGFGREGSHFTFSFDKLIMDRAKDMSMSALSRELGEPDNTLWRVFKIYIQEEIKGIDCQKTYRIGVDETASKRGHKYVTIFHDKDTGRVIFATEGKDSATFGRFSNHLVEHTGCPDQIEMVSMDMSNAFIKGQRADLPNAEVSFDRFHIKQGLNKAVDKVRKNEVKENEDLKKTKYLWLKKKENLTEKQKQDLEVFLEKCSTNTARAYQQKVSFDELWGVSESAVEPLLTAWNQGVRKLKLGAMTKFVETVERHWDGIIKSIKTGINNGYAEGLNSLIQLAKSRARGFRNTDNFINMIYFLGNKFSFKFH